MSTGRVVWSTPSGAFFFVGLRGSDAGSSAAINCFRIRSEIMFISRMGQGYSLTVRCPRLRESAGAGEDIEEHGFREAAGVGVLQRRMIARNDFEILGDAELRSV